MTDAQQRHTEPKTGGGGATTPKMMVVAALTAVLFFFGLLILERIPEIPVDVDFKPFFIPLLFVALLPFGKTTMAVALGAALGEAIGDPRPWPPRPAGRSFAAPLVEMTCPLHRAASDGQPAGLAWVSPGQARLGPRHRRHAFRSCRADRRTLQRGSVGQSRSAARPSRVSWCR
jgi:hypothetical protein